MMGKLKKINEVEIIPSDKDFSYQWELTQNRLDKLDSDFTQKIINEIVLWKVNRYAKLDNKTLSLLNNINKSTKVIDEDLTRAVLVKLINTSGIRLPMASTILRFKNPYIYQIIDQRVYRIIYGDELKLPQLKSPENILNEIELYLKYLDKLKRVCKEKHIDFENSDRILYLVDKRVNSKIKY